MRFVPNVQLPGLSSVVGKACCGHEMSVWVDDPGCLRCQLESSFDCEDAHGVELIYDSEDGRFLAYSHSGGLALEDDDLLQAADQAARADTVYCPECGSEQPVQPASVADAEERMLRKLFPAEYARREALKCIYEEMRWTPDKIEAGLDLTRIDLKKITSKEKKNE